MIRFWIWVLVASVVDMSGCYVSQGCWGVKCGRGVGVLNVGRGLGCMCWTGVGALNVPVGLGCYVWHGVGVFSGGWGFGVVM